MKRQTIVVAYDISSNRKRRKVAKLLEQKGVRVNKSVFECILTAKEYENVKIDIDEIIGKRDSVVFYQLCASCAVRTERVGCEVSSVSPIIEI